MEGLAICLLVLVHWVGEPARHAYEARVAALRAAGQPVRYADLETARVPDEENAAVPFAEAATILKQNPHLYINLESAAPEERAELAEYLDSLKPYFETLAQVPKRPRWHVEHAWDKGPGASFDEIAWIQGATEHLGWRVALDAEEKGRTRRAAEASVLVLDLGDRCRIPMLLGHLVSQTVVVYPARFLKVASKQPGFDAAEFRRIVDPRLARAMPGTGPLAAAIEQERVVVFWVVDEIRSGKKSIVDDYLPMKGLLHRSRGWRLFLYRDANRALDLFEEAIALAKKPPEEALRAAALLRKKCEASKLMYPVTGMTAWFLPRLFDVYAKRVACQRLTRVVMALLEYRGREGKWPESLAPLGDLPHDPYTGKPFLYERLETGARIRVAKDDAWTGKRLAEWDEWQRLEEDGLAWTFEE
ncbi:MAG TPA: hypothetical protein VFY93_09445 [Planctomycetota bacterium]|nr:hypothetical protein [Planctomycetota bacterium]